MFGFGGEMRFAGSERVAVSLGGRGRLYQATRVQHDSSHAEQSQPRSSAAQQFTASQWHVWASVMHRILSHAKSIHEQERVAHQEQLRILLPGVRLFVRRAALGPLPR